LIQFNSNKEILSNYYFDLEKLFLNEFLTNRIVYHDDHIYVKYNTKLLYNPLTEAFFALIFYKKDISIFLKLVNNLIKKSTYCNINNINTICWRYDFAFPPRASSPGWISGMTQAVVASTFARAFYLTGKDDYKRLAVKAIRATLLPIEAGGALYAKGRWLWIEEYPSERPVKHVLNGFMYALLGIYDVYLITKSENYLKIFHNFIYNLISNAHIYSILGHWTKYDIESLADPKYHFVHTILVYVLHNLTNSKPLYSWFLKWREGFLLFDNFF
jgi:hypothetical protein